MMRLDKYLAEMGCGNPPGGKKNRSVREKQQLTEQW